MHTICRRWMRSPTMGWLRLVGSLILQVSFAEYSLFYRALLQKRPFVLRSLLIVATPYLYTHTKEPHIHSKGPYTNSKKLSAYTEMSPGVYYLSQTYTSSHYLLQLFEENGLEDEARLLCAHAPAEERLCKPALGFHTRHHLEYVIHICRDSFICAMTHIIHVIHDSFIRAKTHVFHDSFIRAKTHVSQTLASTTAIT